MRDGDFFLRLPEFTLSLNLMFSMNFLTLVALHNSESFVSPPKHDNGTDRCAPLIPALLLLSIGSSCSQFIRILTCLESSSKSNLVLSVQHPPMSFLTSLIELHC